jgi:NADH-quinone oxidoreductase subunit E
MVELAEIFEIRPIEVMEVLSFYNMFFDSPQAKHHVYVCTNLPCSLRGARGLLHQLESHLGIKAPGETPDGRIFLGHEECLGACGYAPMMRVDGQYHEDLDVDKAKRILDSLGD